MYWTSWKIDAKRHDAYSRLAATRYFCADGPSEANANEGGKPTPFFAMPPQDATFATDKSRDTTGHDVGKRMPSVATPIIAVPPKDASISAGEPPDTIRHDVGK
jgi:hypothetical protein